MTDPSEPPCLDYRPERSDPPTTPLWVEILIWLVLVVGVVGIIALAVWGVVFVYGQ